MIVHLLCLNCIMFVHLVLLSFTNEGKSEEWKREEWKSERAKERFALFKSWH